MARKKKKLKRRRKDTASEYSPESSSEGSDGPTFDAKFMKLLGEADKQLKQKNEAPTYATYFTYLQSSRGGSKSFAE